MSVNLSVSATNEEFRIGLGGEALDTRGKPTKRAIRVNAHSGGTFILPSQERADGGLSFAAVLERNRTAHSATTTALSAMRRPTRAVADSNELAAETIELQGKRKAAEDRPRDPRFPKTFEVERTVGAATPERDSEHRRKPPWTEEKDDRQQDGNKRPFDLGRRPAPVAASQPLAVESVSEELAEWERALLLDDEKPGTVPLVGRAPKPAGSEPVLITGRGRQRGALPSVRRANLPAPRVPASKIIATSKPLGKRAFSMNVAQSGQKDPRQAQQASVRPRLITGGHPGRI